MTLEEFFKKKRIDLPALEMAEPELFSEFKNHYEEMGEKSFDHTKKYWFNKLRHQFHLAPEVKTEKIHIANPLAEQTITESLIETPVPSAPKPGFVPRFKASNTPKAQALQEEKEEEVPVNPAPGQSGENTPVTPAYKLRFSMKSVPPKPEE